METEERRGADGWLAQRLRPVFQPVDNLYSDDGVYHSRTGKAAGGQG